MDERGMVSFQQLFLLYTVTSYHPLVRFAMSIIQDNDYDTYNGSEGGEGSKAGELFCYP